MTINNTTTKRNDALINEAERRVAASSIYTIRAGNKRITMSKNLLHFLAADAGFFSVICKEIVNAAQLDELPGSHSFTRYNSVPTIDNGIIKYVSHCYIETIYFDGNTLAGMNSRFVLSKIGLNKPTDSIVSHDIHQYTFIDGKQSRVTKQYEDVEIKGQKCFKHFRTVEYLLK